MPDGSPENNVKWEGLDDMWKSGRRLLVAHRGASGHAPENTVKAFRLAARFGADAIETDVRRTRDDRLVLVHDETLDRTTDGKGRVRDFSLEDLGGLDAGGWFGPAFAGERILTLDEGLEIFKSLGVGGVFEIKEQETCAGVAKTIRDHGFTGRTHIVSFFPGAIRAIKEFDPTLSGTIIFDPRGEIFRREDPVSNIVGIAGQAGAEGVALFDAVATPAMTAAFRKAGLRFTVLLIDTVEQARQALRLDPDAILTNYPDRVRAVLHEEEEGRRAGGESARRAPGKAMRE